MEPIRRICTADGRSTGVNVNAAEVRSLDALVSVMTASERAVLIEALNAGNFRDDAEITEVIRTVAMRGSDNSLPDAEWRKQAEERLAQAERSMGIEPLTRDQLRRF